MRLFFPLTCLLLGATQLPAADMPAPTAASAPEFELFAARPDETRLADQLVGLRIVATPAQLADPGFPAPGIDPTRVPLCNREDFYLIVAAFMDQPVSKPSLDRLVLAVQHYVHLQGKSLVSVYLPPQDITGGYVQIVVSEAKSAGAIKVVGAKYFSEATYLAALSQDPDQPVNEAGLKADVDWINRNPYRQARLAAGSGPTAGSTQINLLVQERAPWAVSASVDNTGTKSTEEQRVSAGVSWANAFGRGDMMNYRFIADPSLEHSRTHTAGYTAFLPWRHIASLSAMYTDLDSIMPEPFTQRGTSWQTSLRYEVPLRAPRAGWAQNLSFTADFKYSDNNIEFALVPVTNNATHVVQAGANYGFTFPALGGQNSVYLSGHASPGGLTDYNTDEAYAGTRPGAKASYVYGALTFSHQRPLGRWSWMTNANLQLASGALLGSEQLNGGGSGAVRGYAESTAFGDWGVVVNNELHAPGFGLFKGRDQLDLFAFVDFASLNLHVDHESTDLRSAGLGLNYQFGRHFSARAAYGWHDDNSNGPFTLHSGHGHISVSLDW